MAETLKRRIGLGLLTAYGVGVMVGAGIYVLVGAVAGSAGVWTPVSFLIAGLIAAPSALSYAELSTRIPKAAGEAAYVEQAFGLRWLALVIGFGIVVAGTISAAAVLRGGAGYLGGLVPLGQPVLIAGLGLFLIGVALIGVLESLAIAALFTVIELTGLILVIWAGLSAEPSLPWQAPVPVSITGLGIGAVLAFFAFIGFEDIVNMAEEVRNPTKTLPRAIILSLIVTSVIYALVSMAAVRAVAPFDLSHSTQPLVDVWRARTGGSAAFLSAIAVAAALNGVLAQIVMASRVLFGMGRDRAGLALFAHTSARFGTPVTGTIVVGVAVIVAALALPVSALASVTSTVLLAVFVIINLALLRLKRVMPEAPFHVPTFVPLIGAVVAAGALILSFVWGTL